MRRTLVILIATILVLVLAGTGLFIRNQIEASQLNTIVMHYYENPDAGKVPSIMLRAASAGLLDRCDTKWIFTTFLSELMRKNPDRIATWVEQLKSLTASQRHLLWAALWQSGTKEGVDQLVEFQTTTNSDDKQYIVALLGQPSVPFEKKTITCAGALDVLWTCFFARGDEKYVNRIIDSLPLPDSHGNDLLIGSMAEWSLAANARVHPKVMQICQDAQRARPALTLKLLDVIERANKTIN